MTSVVRTLRVVLHPIVWLWDHSIGFVLTWLLIGVITLYRHTISPTLPPTCRYHPSCSAYALEAVTGHGAVRGTWLSMRRIGRCHPWAAGGYDPVPSPASSAVESSSQSPSTRGA